MTTRLARREVLRLGTAAALGAAAGSLGLAALRGGGSTEPRATGRPTGPSTVAGWVESRQAPYYIAHRGAADVAPEHTLAGYQTALAWGAPCLEISVVQSADGVLYCLQDLDLDRTTTGRGPAAALPAAALDAVMVRVPRLGPRWSGPRMPPLPRLTDVLDAVGGRTVLALEAKDDAAFPAVLQLVQERDLQRSVMIRLKGGSPRLRQVKDDGYPVVAHLDGRGATRTAAVELGRRLDPRRDALVLPAQVDGSPVGSAVVDAAVGTGVPVWLEPVRRRSEVEHFARLGAEGMVSPDLGYLSGAEPRRTVDGWSSGGLSPGELTREPGSNRAALVWDTEAGIGLAAAGHQAFVSMGQFGPLTATSYRVTFDAGFDPAPRDTWEHLSVAFGHRDDRYYEHRLGTADGYHALLRANGNLALYAHLDGRPEGQLLAPSTSGRRLQPGVWSRLTLDVAPDLIRWSRDDGTSVEVRDTRFRGGYFHIGRSSTDGTLRLRNLAVA